MIMCYAGAIAVEIAVRIPDTLKALMLSGPNVGPVGVSMLEMAAINIFSKLIPSMAFVVCRVSPGSPHAGEACRVGPYTVGQVL